MLVNPKHCPGSTRRRTSPQESAGAQDWRATSGYKGHRITPEGFDVGIVAYHQMIDHIRKDKRNNTTDNFEEVKSNVNISANGELKQILLKAINELNPTQKSLVLLKDYEGYSYQEIGEIMDLSESQVKVYLHRARLILKEKLVHLEKMRA